MTTLLHVDCSITGADSVSRQLSAAIVARCKELIPNLTLIRRDLFAMPLAHFNQEHLKGRSGAVSEPAIEAELERTEERKALAELIAADILVLGVPMYNLTIPSQLKTWIDHITVAGKTFRYTPAGAIGLLKGKKVFLASARGGIYAESSSNFTLDYQEPYLRALFNFLGIHDITVIRAEGVRISPEIAKTAVASALASCANLDLAPVVQGPSFERASAGAK